jgi:hypothetical protein
MRSPPVVECPLVRAVPTGSRTKGRRRSSSAITTEQRLAKLEAVLAQGTNDLNQVVPLLADLLSIPMGDRYPPLNLTPQKCKEMTALGPIGATRGTSGASTGADGVRGRALE